METYWLTLGFVAQGVFTTRFIVQWLASERAGQSVIPLAFWFLSIAGSMLLLIYAIHRHDPVFILGQGAGVGIYLRNLHFRLRDQRAHDHAVGGTPGQAGGGT